MIYVDFYLITTYIHGFDSYNCVHRDVYIVQILLEFPLTWIWLIWLLAFHMPWDHSDSTFHCPFESYIRNPLVHWRHIERIETKETIVHCFRNLYLSLHPFVPWSSFMWSSQACILLVSLLSKWWRIEVVEAQVGNLVSPVRRRAVRGCLYLVISDFY